MDQKKQTLPGKRTKMERSARRSKGRAGEKRSVDNKSAPADGQRTRRASQRAYLRQLRVEQTVRQEQEESRRRNGIPLWARTLIAVAAVLLVLLVFFRVEEFQVSGNVRYTADEVAAASGITSGDVLMSVNKTRAASRILVKLPYVRQVTMSKALPGTIRFDVVECKALVGAESEFGARWLMNSDGKLLEKLSDDAEMTLPLIQGVILELPNAGDPASFDEEQKGERAMEVARALEEAGLLQTVKVIDVSDPDDVILSYDDRVEVYIGDGTDVDYRLQYMIGAMAKLDADVRGSLDISFQEGNHAVFHPMITEEELRRQRQAETSQASEEEAPDEEGEPGESGGETVGEESYDEEPLFDEEEPYDDEESYDGGESYVGDDADDWE